MDKLAYEIEVEDLHGSLLKRRTALKSRVGQVTVGIVDLIPSLLDFEDMYIGEELTQGKPL